MEGNPMATLLESIGVFFTWLISCVGEVITFIMGNPILIIFIAGFVVSGFVLGWVFRLFRSN